MARTVFVLIALLSACAPHHENAVLRRRLETPITALNPLLTHTSEERMIAQALFTPLLYLDASGHPIPGLATLVSATDTTFRFRLRDATFSDGTRVSARDVLFTARAIRDPVNKSQLFAEFDDLDLARSRVLNDREVELSFRGFRPDRTLTFTSLYILPAHVYAGSTAVHDRTIIGSGPYVVASRTPDRLLLKRRTPYWLPFAGAETIEFVTIENATTAWQALRKGDIDEMVVSRDQWTRNDHAGLVLRPYTTTNYTFLTYNTKHTLLADPAVRRALASCVPVDEIIRDIFAGHARRLTGPFLPGTAAYDAEVPAVLYDPGAARAVIQERFGSRRPSLQLLVLTGNPTNLRIAQVLAQTYRQAGIDLELVTMDPAAGIDAILKGDYQITMLSLDLDLDPDVGALFLSSQQPPLGKNIARYQSSEVDALIAQARGERDSEGRNRIYQAIHRRLAQDQPFTWLYQTGTLHAFRERVTNVQLATTTGPYRWFPGDLAWNVR
jgi:peptide/nickel transport system substrate-binding protein